MTGQKTPFSPAGLHALVAEDNEINQKLVSMMLRAEGIRACVVPNGLRAVEMAREQDFDFILMDIHMPEMDGLEAVRRIRDWEEGRRVRVPIFAMTAGSLGRDREACLKAGMDDYIPKPLEISDICQAIRRWVRRNDDPCPGLAGPEESQSFELFPQADPPTGEAPGPAPRPVSEPPVDLEAALPNFFNSRPLLMELLGELVTQSRIRLDEMRSAVEAGQARELMRAAHSLKGSSANFQARRISQICAAIEARAGSGDIGNIEERISELDKEIERLSQYWQATQAEC